MLIVRAFLENSSIENSSNFADTRRTYCGRPQRVAGAEMAHTKTWVISCLFVLGSWSWYVNLNQIPNTVVLYTCVRMIRTAITYLEMGDRTIMLTCHAVRNS